MNPIYSIVNGEFILKDEAVIAISDLSIMRGFGVFDFLRTVNYRPVFLEDHLERFYFSAAEMMMNVGCDRHHLIEMIHRLIDKNKMPDSGIRITLTGGYAEDNYTMTKPNLLITQSPFLFDDKKFNKGIKLITFLHQRQLPQVKTIDYLMAIRLQDFIKEKNADDLLYQNGNEICECPRSNFFIVTKNDEVITPSKNILRGITRKKILGFSDLAISEGAIKPEDLLNIKEAFITSTTKNVLPVLEIDGKQIGNGKPGKMTTKIYERLVSIKENG